MRLLRDAGVDAPVVVGGIIPDADRPALTAAGVAAIYTPKDFRLAVILGDLIDLATEHRRGHPVRRPSAGRPARRTRPVPEP